MATWTLTAQLTTGTLTVNTTDRLWFTSSATAIGAGTEVVVGQYQDGTHITNNSDTHQCTTNHVNNIKFLTGSTYSLNGGGSTSFSTTAPTTATCPFKFNFSDAASVATSSATLYAYDGTTDATAMAGVTFQAFEKISTTNTPSWTAANGSGSALSLGNQSAATSHDFFIGMSLSPSSTGAKTGKVKITLTYV